MTKNKTITPTSGFDLNNPNEKAALDGPVECLGKTFANDTERRKFYLKILAEKLKDPKFRKIEGFPIGEDINILAMSDPPYYTACPNPFIADFVAYYGRPYGSVENYKREPYAADVSEGKNDPIYNAHSYHTKVPHKAIMRYILHYTNPGDLVFDGFCGTGMTGVAAKLCGDRKSIESLGYTCLGSGEILNSTVDAINKKSNDDIFSLLGERKAILCDLSPAATFIAQNCNSPKNINIFYQKANEILDQIENEFGWIYETKHFDGSIGKINYVVWSDVYSCPECSSEVIFWDSAVDREKQEVHENFNCGKCSSKINKRSILKIWETKINKYTNTLTKTTKIIPVLINYSVSGKRFEKKPDANDFLTLEKVNELSPNQHVPTNEIIDGKEIGRLKNNGFLYTNQLLPERANIVLAAFIERCTDDLKLKLSVTATLLNLSWMYRWRANGKGGTTSGTYYICSTPQENNAIKHIRAKVKDILMGYIYSSNLLSTQDSSRLDLPGETIDYMFFDPPFGSNLMYSELSYLWESWLGIFTNSKMEAIENQKQSKGVNEYRTLMGNCFKEAYRLLKPGRWITVEFSNTQSSIWNSIQLALTDAGFIVANVSALDKKQGSFKAVTTTTAVKQDLVISAYKPNGGFENRFVSESNKDGMWDFIRTHLSYLPIVKKELNQVVKIPERDPRILFDQVVSYFVRNLRDVPISSKEFQEGLRERFVERDGMFFLSEQVSQYDKIRLTSTQLRQLDIFVDDESSAIEWLRQSLSDKPQTYQDIHPKFIHQLSGWKKSEMQLELAALLEENFLKFDSQGQIPPQIHSYLSTNFKDMRNLAKDDDSLIQKAKDRWYVPNPDREEDLQKLRERSLLKQFEEYKMHTGKKLKIIRLEAVRTGFKKAWIDRDYKTIIAVAEKIPEDLLQEDQKLLMWYDQAINRLS